MCVGDGYLFNETGSREGMNRLGYSITSAFGIIMHINITILCPFANSSKVL